MNNTRESAYTEAFNHHYLVSLLALSAESMADDLKRGGYPQDEIDCERDLAKEAREWCAVNNPKDFERGSYGRCRDIMDEARIEEGDPR